MDSMHSKSCLSKDITVIY